MSQEAEKEEALEQERREIKEAREKGRLSLLGTFIKLSGPGWLQSAITLGGGSLASGLYLGMIGGKSMLWVQPLAMILGVIMLSSIAYVTLTSRERPFDAMRKHVNPVLAWGWLIATVTANMVWALPQFSLATAAIRQNLAPQMLGEMADMPAQLICVGAILAVCITLIWFYDTGSTGVKIFEGLVRCMVGLIVVAFIGVVIKLSFSAQGIDWANVLPGFIPDIDLLWSPPETYDPFLQDLTAQGRQYWSDLIVDNQRDRMIAASAVAVGINMTFLLPYSMLKRGWDRDFRGLATFDLATGLFIPFMLVTSCIILSSATQFHTQPSPGLLPDSDVPESQASEDIRNRYNGLLQTRAKNQVKNEMGQEQFAALSEQQQQERIQEGMQELPRGEKEIAAMVVNRDAFDLAESLQPLTGKIFSHYVFGAGVVGVAVSSVIILMLINGFAVCEALGIPSSGYPYRFACMAPAVGALGPFVWSGASFYLAVPTSVFCMSLLPVAYIGFYLMMNQRSLLGEDTPTGGWSVLFNSLMGIAVLYAGAASLWSVWSKGGYWGLSVAAGFILLVLIVQFTHVAPDITLGEGEDEQEGPA